MLIRNGANIKWKRLAKLLQIIIIKTLHEVNLGLLTLQFHKKGCKGTENASIQQTTEENITTEKLSKVCEASLHIAVAADVERKLPQIGKCSFD